MTAASLILTGDPAVSLLVRSTLLIGAAWLAALALRQAGGSAATRHLAWLSGIAALLLSALMPALVLPVLPDQLTPAGLDDMAGEGRATGAGAQDSVR